MVKFNKVVLSQKLFNALEKWSSRCTLVHTSLHRNCFIVHETYDVLEVGFSVHEINLKLTLDILELQINIKRNGHKCCIEKYCSRHYE